ncbi:hypothetical protein ACLM5J_11595 [Nocardioides sp. Bht2]|uniref:hypothetical protein n=1 Tax=Nocardioides sp. Bht2 TaxID=3392297 RepID=UPI0039B4F482
MIGGHLGDRVSGLIDGRYDGEAADKLWAHVHGCGVCRDQVEYEGWIKSQIAGLSGSQRQAPSYLASLLTEPSAATEPAFAVATAPARRSSMTAAMVGAGSVGAAVLGVIALAGPIAPADRPMDRRGPASSVFRSPESTGVNGPNATPSEVPGPFGGAKPVARRTVSTPTEPRSAAPTADASLPRR